MIRFRQRQRIESRARDTQPIRSVRSSLTIRLARGCKNWQTLALVRIYRTRRNPLSEYMSVYLSLKLRINCEPLLRIKWEIYFYKEVFRSFIEFRKSCLMAIQHQLQRFLLCGVSSLILLFSCSYESKNSYLVEISSFKDMG